MIVRSKKDRKLEFPECFLSGAALNTCKEAKYLGHILTDLSIR